MNCTRFTLLLLGWCLMAEGIWKDLRSMPEGVAGGAAAILADRIYYAGGATWVDGVKHWLREVRVFDPVSGDWTNGPPLPEPLAYVGFIQSDNAFEVLGGLNETGSSRNCWLLKTHATAWVKSGTLPQDATFARAELVNGMTYLFGGCASATDLTQCTKAVWRRDLAGKWSRVSGMPDGPVALRGSAVVKGRIYLFGGCTAESATAVRNVDEAWQFDPNSNDWKKLRSLSPMRSMSAMAIDDRRILLAGGFSESFSDAVQVYDTVLDRYEPFANLPFKAAGIEFVRLENFIFGLGGEDRMRGRSQRLIQTSVAPTLSNKLDAR
jgi:N-acetylneuraminic acid mutarotase